LRWYNQSMSNRASATLDGDAYALYKRQPYHRRGEYLSRLIKADAAGQNATRGQRVMVATIMEEIQRLQERLLKILEE
jgi:hypothetical protein